MPEVYNGFAPRLARVLDFESTGRPEDEDPAICEYGCLDVDLAAAPYPVIAGSASTSLINPRRPIPAETMAVHHITDADVADAPLVAEAWMALGRGMTEADVYVAHNAEFERHFYSNRPQRWICTYKCALRAWPDAPGHSNQVLRYHLGLQVDREAAMPPHRALPDCIVTAEILRALLALRPLERLIEISGEPALQSMIRFGNKHRGKSYKEVAIEDRSYLTWIVEKSDLDKDTKFSAGHWLRVTA